MDLKTLDFKTRLTDFLDLLKNMFPHHKRNVAIAKIQLMPLLIWMPKRVAERVYKELEPYMEHLERKEVDKLVGEGLSKSFPGLLPSINLQSMLKSLDQKQKNILSERICDVFDEAGKALSKPTIKTKRLFGKSRMETTAKRKRIEEDLPRKRVSRQGKQ